VEPIIYIGYDSREKVAYDVCKYSIEKRASKPVEIRSLNLELLRRRGLYWRKEDSLASTEFTYSRFLVPYLCNYVGNAVFVDCDFLFLADVWELLDQFDPNKSIQCVQHDYKPTETVKMDGAQQTVYPRKNWSSLMLLNCEHRDCKNLTISKVNTETGKYLHRFEWAKDENLGEISHLWNYLEGWYPSDGSPKAVHHTRGGPWFKEYQNVDWGKEWLEEYKDMTGKDFTL
jgi:hypothetical protein